MSFQGSLAADEVAYVSFTVGTRGDFDQDGRLSVTDIDLLIAKISAQQPDPSFDLNSDGAVDSTDLQTWTMVLKRTWIGDADLDGEFNSGDLIGALAAGTYESEVGAGWASGDFDGSGRFDSSDLIFALADGGYEAGPRVAVSAVPEPSTGIMGLIAWLLMISRRRRTSLFE